MWTFLQFLLCVLAPPKMLKTLFVLTSLCIHVHQERGSQLSKWIYPIYPPKAFIQTSAWGWDLEKFSLLHTSYSLDFGFCFTFNLLKFKPKYCFKKILHKEKFHFLVSFSFETPFEVCQNDLEQVFENCSNPPIVHSRSDTDVVQITYRTLSSYSWLPQPEVSEIPWLFPDKCNNSLTNWINNFTHQTWWWTQPSPPPFYLCFQQVTCSVHQIRVFLWHLEVSDAEVQLGDLHCLCRRC